MCVCMSALATHFNPYSRGLRRTPIETCFSLRKDKRTRSQTLGREMYRSITELLLGGWIVSGGPKPGKRLTYISEST